MGLDERLSHQFRSFRTNCSNIVFKLKRVKSSQDNDIFMKKALRSIILLALMSLLLACGNFGNMDFPGVYKIAIPQGNIITQEMVDQLRPGMTKRQVIFVMGTPLVRDPFHQDRWDYVYNFQPGGGVRGQERLSVFFVEDALINFTGDFIPTGEVDQTETI